ncbi:uncharacterized protein METZ01_LOCUS136380, partial [marine metagenome]
VVNYGLEVGCDWCRRSKFLNNRWPLNGVTLAKLGPIINWHLRPFSEINFAALSLNRSRAGLDLPRVRSLNWAKRGHAQD